MSKIMTTGLQERMHVSHADDRLGIGFDVLVAPDALGFCFKWSRWTKNWQKEGLSVVARTVPLNARHTPLASR